MFGEEEGFGLRVQVRRMEGGVGASTGEEGVSSEGREGEGRSLFSMVEYGLLVWLERRREGA